MFFVALIASAQSMAFNVTGRSSSWINLLFLLRLGITKFCFRSRRMFERRLSSWTMLFEIRLLWNIGWTLWFCYTCTKWLSSHWMRSWTMLFSTWLLWNISWTLRYRTNHCCTCIRRLSSHWMCSWTMLLKIRLVCYFDFISFDKFIFYFSSCGYSVEHCSG